MERCTDCGSFGVTERLLRPTGERVWTCPECDALWREGDDRSATSFMQAPDYLAAAGLGPEDVAVTRSPTPLPALPEAWSGVPLTPLQEAWLALRRIVAEGRLSALGVGDRAGEARDVVGPWDATAAPLNAAQVIPAEEAPVRLRLSGGVVVELLVDVTEGRLELPGVLDEGPGPDLTALSRADVESVLRQAGARTRPRREGIAFETGRFAGELDFQGDRLGAVRVRAAG
ncbi:hypothetical protein ACQEU5_13550 [Marinactinospora thermotolerans]|uniref:Uncharacterized protein n=1 Tax=Marinactinospora thermotolerans DSM 45154 TaxID=1122192 RepID=A0A1T4SFK0_9ACTN|nr:hypothetical protein [Marinactinospora thermotolerans]SKA27120.1 hypothetical protein SAMN02745673_03520 [Marinactinospora thermotolerans DSM 45154]